MISAFLISKKWKARNIGFRRKTKNLF